MIHDQIVVGIRDKAKSQKLHLDTNLTLESAKKVVRQNKAMRVHQVNGFQEEGLPVEAIGNTGAGVRSRKLNRRAKPFSKSTESARPQPTTCNKCMRCGKGPHSREHWPAN